MNPLETLSLYFQYKFVIYALIAGTMIALSSSLLGVTLVLKRYSFIGDGLSHTAFGALALATVLHISNTMYFVLPITVLFAVLILCAGNKAKIKGDAAIALISVSSLALGYLIMNIFSPPANLSGDVCSTLFGSTSILTLKKGEVWLCVGLSALVLLLYIVFYHKIFAATFDPDFATACGTNVKMFNFVMAVIVAVIIVLAMNLVGSLLISALIIFPAVSAMKLFRTFRSVSICAVILSVFCALFGILISIVAGTPIGATIVALQLAVFIICSTAGFFIK